MADIITIKGETFTPPEVAAVTPIPNVEIIERLEDLLQRAKDGKIVGMAYALVGSDEMEHTTGYLWKKGAMYAIATGVGLLFHRVMQAVDE
jgi:pyruvoyl-dependent arginine decarboxylase (PvlArgDC)